MAMRALRLTVPTKSIRGALLLAGICTVFGLMPSALAAPLAGSTQSPADEAVRHGIKVSDNRRYLADAVNGRPVFLLADTAWNLPALTLEEIDTYFKSRADHGFNAVMFALNFAPQADEKNAYGEPAYIGADKNTLNPAYFMVCDDIVNSAARHGLFVIIYSMWAGDKAGTMNHYSAAQLTTLGQALGRRYQGVANVIFSAGGEASPHYIEPERVNALGRGLREGSAGRNLITTHPVAENSTSKFYSAQPWLDFYMSQAKSGNAVKNTAYDAAALVLADWHLTGGQSVKPTMMGEHRYESGTGEDPLIQRRSLYQCVFAGGAGYAYGHNALWQMSPHTGLPWMLKGWAPGVKNWTEALDTPAVRQLQTIKRLLYSRPYFERIPDQDVILAGQGADIATRIQATRDGAAGRKDATYIMAYLSAPQPVTLDTSVIAAGALSVSWFDPATGARETAFDKLPNPGQLRLEKRPHGDWVVLVEDASKHYASALDGPTTPH